MKESNLAVSRATTPFEPVHRTQKVNCEEAPQAQACRTSKAFIESPERLSMYRRGLHPLTLATSGLFSVLQVFLFALPCVLAEAPPRIDYCQRLQQEIQNRKHGFLAGNLAYYVGGFHASWELKEHETLGLTHPFYHDLRSRGVGLVQSSGTGPDNTGIGNDFSGWEFYKDTRVLVGSVIVDGKTHRNPIPVSMKWQPDKMICEYRVGEVHIREEKFISLNDVACTIITSDQPILLRFEGQSFVGRHSIESTANIQYHRDMNALRITEGGTTHCVPDTDRIRKTGPIMYQGMHTVLSSSRDFGEAHRLEKGPLGQWTYEIDLPCDSEGVAVAWAMHDDARTALLKARKLLQKPHQQLAAKTAEMNRQLNEEIPWFRCSDPKHEDIYYFLWSLYLMYYIDVDRDWETVPHTQTAVNNFLGMHRYDATFQIKVGSWLADKRELAYGNVLTWKPLFEAGHYRKSPDGVVALSDNKGRTWHSGAYGNELSEHVRGAWQIYQHTADLSFLTACYDSYFREVFWDRIASFYSNHFEVAEILAEMARQTGHLDDIAHWTQQFPNQQKNRDHWFRQRWEVHDHEKYFGGPRDGMLMTTGFWHMRSKYFPRKYAKQMTDQWATNSERGFYGQFFPLAMSRHSMRQFATQDDLAFGYTPDTAYFTLSGMFHQRLFGVASRLTLNHLEHYNYHDEWQLPVAPEAYRRDGSLFGDQFSNFNAGKILLYLEGFAGLEYSLPQNRLIIRESMPQSWEWMEFRLPLSSTEGGDETWTTVRVERKGEGKEIIKTISVSDSPLQITIAPWLDDQKQVSTHPHPQSSPKTIENTTDLPDSPIFSEYTFAPKQNSASVELHYSR